MIIFQDNVELPVDGFDEISQEVIESISNIYIVVDLEPFSFGCFDLSCKVSYVYQEIAYNLTYYMDGTGNSFSFEFEEDLEEYPIQEDFAVYIRNILDTCYVFNP